MTHAASTGVLVAGVSAVAVRSQRLTPVLARLAQIRRAALTLGPSARHYGHLVDDVASEALTGYQVRGGGEEHDARAVDGLSGWRGLAAGCRGLYHGGVT